MQLQLPALLTLRSEHAPAKYWVWKMLAIKRVGREEVWAIPIAFNKETHAHYHNGFATVNSVSYLSRFWDIHPVTDEDVTALLLERP